MLLQFGFSQVLDYLYKPNIYGQSPRGEREHHGCPWLVMRFNKLSRFRESKS